MMDKAKKAWMEACAVWPVAKGSLAEVKKRCNRPGCKRCASGEQHVAWQYTNKMDGRSCSYHVPARAVAEIRQALENGRQLERMMMETAIAILDAHRKTRKGKNPS